LPSVQSAKVRALGLEALVDHIVYADEHATGGKPAIEPFLEVLRRLQTSPEHAVMVGDDRINDVEGARGAGMRTILLARHGRPSLDGGADVIVDHLSDVSHIAFELIAGRVAYAA
jgi:putative hydrolase of the HAD superfamily